MDLKYKYHWNLFYTSLQVISFDLYWHRENMTSQSKSLHLCTSDSPTHETETAPSQRNNICASYVNTMKFFCLTLKGKYFASYLLLYTLFKNGTVLLVFRKM